MSCPKLIPISEVLKSNQKNWKGFPMTLKDIPTAKEMMGPWKNAWDIHAGRQGAQSLTQ